MPIASLISFKDRSFGNITNVPTSFYVGIFATTAIAIALQLGALIVGFVAKKNNINKIHECLDKEIIEKKWPKFLDEERPLGASRPSILKTFKILDAVIMAPTIFVALSVVPQILSSLGPILEQKALNNAHKGLAEFCKYITGELALVPTMLAFRVLQTAFSISTHYLNNKDVMHDFDPKKTSDPNNKRVCWLNILVATILLRAIVIPVGFSLINRSVQYSIKSIIEAITKEALNNNASIAINAIVAPLIKGVESMVSCFAKDMMPDITDRDYDPDQLLNKAKGKLLSNFLEGMFNKLIGILIVDIALTHATKAMEKYTSWVITNVVSAIIDYAAVEGLISNAIIYGGKALIEKIKSSGRED